MRAEDRSRSVLVTGAGGQDGTLLIDLLRRSGFVVHGVHRASTGVRRPPATGGGVTSHAVDLVDAVAVRELLDAVDPDCIVNLAAQSSVARSWQDPESTHRINAVLPDVLLSWARRRLARGRPPRFVQASSAEIFAPNDGAPLTELSQTGPVSPYGESKLIAHELVQEHRTAGLAASNLILFPHESPLRQEHFVTRRITRGVALIAAGRETSLELGNIAARRDWGWAEEYMAVVPLLLDRPGGDDLVLATGVGHSVQQFVSVAFRSAGLDDWQGYVRTTAVNVRPRDADNVVGDARKALRDLGWRPQTSFEQVVQRMVHHDLRSLSVVDA